MATLYNLDMANLFVGDDDPTDGKFLALKSIKIPDMEEVTKTHMGGGAMAELTIGMRAFKISPLTFKLEGLNLDVDARFMPAGLRRIKYTIKANVTDLRTHENIALKTIVEGRMTKMSKSDFERDKGIDSDYEINEITFMEVFENDVEKLYFNYWQGPAGVRRNGVLIAAEQARNLGIV